MPPPIVGQCETDPVTGVSGDIYNAYTITYASISGALAMSPGAVRNSFAAMAQAIATGVYNVYAGSISGAFVPTGRVLATSAPLRIDGGASADLSADRTLTLQTDTSLTITGANELAVVFGLSANTACEGNDARLSDDRTASGIRTATTVVALSAAAAPAVGAVLRATSSTAATWQTLTASDLSAVPTSRTLTGSDPILIDGGTSAVDLSANRTISVRDATGAQKGVLTLAAQVLGAGQKSTTNSLTVETATTLSSGLGLANNVALHGLHSGTWYALAKVTTGGAILFGSDVAPAVTVQSSLAVDVIAGDGSDLSLYADGNNLARLHANGSFTVGTTTAVDDSSGTAVDPCSVGVGFSHANNRQIAVRNEADDAWYNVARTGGTRLVIGEETDDFGNTIELKLAGGAGVHLAVNGNNGDGLRVLDQKVTAVDSGWQFGRYMRATGVNPVPLQHYDHFVPVDLSAGARTAELISAATAGTGFVVYVFDGTGHAASNNLTIARDGSDTINGAASNLTVSAARGGYVLISDGVSDWHAFALSTTMASAGTFVPTTRTLSATSPIRIDGGGSADLSANRTLSFAVAGEAAGDLLIYSGGWTRLALGANTKVLRGGATSPAWDTIATLTPGAGIAVDGSTTTAQDLWASTRTLKIGFASEAQGDVAFRGTSGWERLAAGTDGYVLTTHGAGANPTWEQASGSSMPTATAQGQIPLATGAGTTYAASKARVYEGSLSTTNATPTTIVTVPFGNSTVVILEALVSCMRTDSIGTAGGGYHHRAVLRRDSGGSVFTVGTPNTLTCEDVASLNLSLTTGASDLQVQVTGIAAQTWAWTASVRVVYAT